MVGRELLTLLRPAGEDHQGVLQVWGDISTGTKTTRMTVVMTKRTAATLIKMSSIPMRRIYKNGKGELPRSTGMDMIMTTMRVITMKMATA